MRLASVHPINDPSLGVPSVTFNLSQLATIFTEPLESKAMVGHIGNRDA